MCGWPAHRVFNIQPRVLNTITKLDQQKFSDALQKLTDFQTAVVALSSGIKPKLSAADAEILLNGQAESAIDEGISGAIACVALLP